MKTQQHFVLATLLISLTGSLALAQNHDQRGQSAQFSEHDQQVTHDWYNQHQSNPPAGFRKQDQLSQDEESNMREGGVIDKNLRKKVYSAPPELTRQLPPPPSRNRYVAVGGHVALIDHNYHVQAVIHLNDNH
jgi:hypothetical protein